MHFGNLIPKSGEIKKKVEEMTKEFETFDNNINSLIYKLNEMKNIINLFKDININILKNFDMRNKNYNILQNLKEIINNNDIYIKIKEINIKKQPKDQICNIIDLYNEINTPLTTIINENNNIQINTNIIQNKINLQNAQIKTISNTNNNNEVTLIYRSKTKIKFDYFIIILLKIIEIIVIY